MKKKKKKTPVPISVTVLLSVVVFSVQFLKDIKDVVLQQPLGRISSSLRDENERREWDKREYDLCFHKDKDNGREPKKSSVTYKKNEEKKRRIETAKKKEQPTAKRKKETESSINAQKNKNKKSE